MNILILPSEDGQNYVTVLGYPREWTTETADKNALAAMVAAQTKNPDEWCWEEYGPEFESRGFTLVNYHRGPTWDEQLVAESGARS